MLDLLFPVPFNVDLELVQIIENPLQNNIGREKDRYKNSVTHVESPLLLVPRFFQFILHTETACLVIG